MTTRRSILTKIVAFIAGLPIIGRAKAKEAPKVPVWNEEHMAVETDFFCIDDFKANPDEGLARMGQYLSDIINHVVKDARENRKTLTQVRVSWHNIREQVANPDGKTGFFRLYFRRMKQSEADYAPLSPDYWDAMNRVKDGNATLPPITFFPKGRNRIV